LALGSEWIDPRDVRVAFSLISHSADKRRVDYRRVFDGAREPEIHALLDEAALPRSGQMVLFDGRTGEPFDQNVTVDDKTYTIELRSQRVYKPYSLKLYEFRHDIYLGTDTPRNYSSKVRLNDPERQEDREVTISMNAPLRVYEGDPLLRKCDTLYQSGFLPVAQAGIRGTVLQVVRNPGWLMPYISCVLVAVGMMIHFGINLFSFLQRRAIL
jgi:hypothetical protein